LAGFIIIPYYLWRILIRQEWYRRLWKWPVST